VKDARDLENQIFAEQVRLLFKQYPVSALSGTLASILFVSVLWSHAPGIFLISWFIAQNVSLVFGGVIAWLYFRAPENSINAGNWYKKYLVGISVVGLLWGSTAMFALFDVASATQTFTIIFVAGVAATALVVAIPVQSAYFLYLSLIISPMLIWLLVQPSATLKAVGGLGAMFFFLLIFAGKNLNRQLVNTIRLRFENADLAAEIRKLNENLEERVKEKTLALSESEERFDLAMQGANDGLWDWDIERNTAYFSPRWKAILGFSDLEIENTPKEWRKRIHKSDLRMVLALIKDHLVGKTDAYESIHRVKHKNGKYRWVLDRARAVRNENGVPYRMVGTQVDITEHKQLEEKLKSANVQLKHEIKERIIAQKELAHLANHDPLTGLPNRILFYEQLQEAIQRATLDGESLAVLLVDLDNFKHVNDTLGHPLGDELLKDVSERLNSIVNKNYFLSRFGGDEFLFIFEDCSDASSIDSFAKDIINLVSQQFHLAGQEVQIGCSIGITMFPEHGSNPDQLISDADIAMYHAKDQGRNRYNYFTQQMDRDINEKVTIRNTLHGALARNEFEVVYQPQVNVASGKITGLEALLRWHPKEVGAVPPDKFIPLLEETGLVVDVGYWVLREACYEAAYLHSQGETDIKIAVNISPRQFLQEDLAEHIQQILSETNLGPTYLEIEITENVFMEEVDLIQKTLLKLQALGIKVTLDDFGTGYSSLAYLKRFPINGIKIDKVFVQDMLKSNDSRQLVTAIIAMAKGLNIHNLVAEGVENEIQLELLRRAECPTYQGYLHSKPQPRRMLHELMFGARNRKNSG